MGVRTTKVKFHKIRGIDQRWQTSPLNANYVQDMTWNDQDSWRRAPGYGRIVRSYQEEERSVKNPSGTSTRFSGGSSSNFYSTSSAPISLYWYSSHNGALQWLLYEDENGYLKMYNGSTAPQTPENSIYHVDGSSEARFVPVTSWAGTTFCTFSSRVYLVNG